MIYLITGTPGAGKTLNAVQTFVEWKKKDHDEVEDPAKRRQFFACNVEGMSIPGVGILPLENFNEWPDLLPDGAVLLLDEAQQVFRPDAARTPPPYITALEMHRHKGIDLILTTQHPTFVHTHIRKLTTLHRHVIPLTNNSAQIFEWKGCNENPDFKRETADVKTWLYPSQFYGQYKSATQHTKKLKWPPWLRKLLLLGVAGVCVLGYLGWQLSSKGAAEASASESSKTPPAAGKGEAKLAPIQSADEYVAQFLPRVRSMPWSAPAYDGHKPQTEPDLYCVAIQIDDSEHCQCYTEQATRYEVDNKTCKHVAEWGNYNPFRRPLNTQQPMQPQQQQQQAGQQAPGQNGALPVATLEQGEALAPRIGSNYAPPTTLPWDPNYFGGGKSR